VKSYLKILGILTRSEKRRVTLLLVCAVLMSFVDVIGMSSLLPFLSVAANPEIISRSSALIYLYKAMNAASPAEFIFMLGLAALIAVVLSNIVAFVTYWAVVWYSFDIGRSVSTRLFKGYIAQPYQFFLSRNSVSLTLNSTDEVEGIINGALLPAMQIVGKATTAALLVLLVIFYDPLLAAIFTGIVGGVYTLIFAVTRRYVAYFGEHGHEARRLRFRKAKEAFGALKELRILGREPRYLDQFVRYSQVYSRNFALHSIIAIAPRYALETLGIATMLVIILYYAKSSSDLAAIIPTMILYAVAGYRLLPAFQAIFGSLTLMRFNRSSLEIVLAQFDSLEGAEGKSSALLEGAGDKPIKLTDAVVFKSVSSRYAEAEEPTLQNVDIVIPVYKTIGIVGASGAGKSTFIDVLTGMLPIESGEMLIDGLRLNESNARAWRRSIGYVPQHIYLADDTIRCNIAFGVPESEIDDSRIEKAARLASIHDFIVSEMPTQYETVIGENGMRLSGGQRQRLGIARALYRDPPVLILDEATSALDGITEDAVIESIRRLGAKKTIVIITHRFASVRDCDNIYLLAGGRVVDQGNYADLLNRNKAFRQMAKVAE
jgi:ABC-type multidrug transport system fused ATPase/permease subunit